MFRGRYTRWILPTVVLLITLLLFLNRQPHASPPRTGSWLYQYNPFAWRTRIENYDWKSTPLEQHCAQGNRNEVPRIVHFIWGMGGDGSFAFPLYLSVRAALKSIRPDVIKIHYTQINRDSVWFRKLEPHVTLVYHDPKDYLKSGNLQAAHMADVLRLQIIKEEGGIYLDHDVYALTSFDNILGSDVVLGHEGGNRYGLANSIIVARPNSTFINRWIEEYSTFDDSVWNYHSVVLPKKLAKEYPICTLSPSAFFWPLWTDSHLEYMHSQLTEFEAFEMETKVKSMGRLYDDQMAYHAWSHVSMEPYLGRLTPEIMRKENTRFNILMRRFLED